MPDTKYFLDETPNPEKDGFGIHTNISKAILNIIKKSNQAADNSFTIGIFGSWGSGKSYIVKQIQEGLAKKTLFERAKRRFTKEDTCFCKKNCKGCKSYKDFYKSHMENAIKKKLKEKGKEIAESNNILFYIDAWKFVGNPLYRSILLDIQNQANKIKPFSDKYLWLFKTNKLNFKKNLYESQSYSEDKFNIMKLIMFLILLVPLIWLLNKKVLPSYCTQPKDILENLGNISSYIIGVVAFAFGLFSIKETKNFAINPTFSPEEFESIFKEKIIEKIVKHNPNTKIVFVFDNIDRCEPDCAYETLTAIKTFMDQKNCLYIIPCDDNAIKDHLETKMSDSNNKEHYANEFMDKIFNTYFRIPELKITDKDTFIENNLKELENIALEDNDIDDIKQIMYHAYKVNTPRQIKRFINDFAMYYYIAQEVDKELADGEKLLENKVLFAIMIAIKQKWQFMEQEIIERSDYFAEYYKDKDFIFIEEVNEMGRGPSFENMYGQGNEDIRDKYEIFKAKYKDFYKFLYDVEILLIDKTSSPLNKYIFLSKPDNEQEIKEKLLKGEKIENITKESHVSIFKIAQTYLQLLAYSREVIQSLIVTFKDGSVRNKNLLDGLILKWIKNEKNERAIINILANDVDGLAYLMPRIQPKIQNKLEMWLGMTDVQSLDIPLFTILDKAEFNNNLKQELKRRFIQATDTNSPERFASQQFALLKLFELASNKLPLDLFTTEELQILNHNNIAILSYLKDKKLKSQEDIEEYFKLLFKMAKYFNENIDEKNRIDMSIKILPELFIRGSEKLNQFIKLVTINDLSNIFKMPKTKEGILGLIAEELYDKFGEEKKLQQKDNYQKLLMTPIDIINLELFLSKIKKYKLTSLKKAQFEKFTQDNFKGEEQELLDVLKKYNI